MTSNYEYAETYAHGVQVFGDGMMYSVVYKVVANHARCTCDTRPGKWKHEIIFPQAATKIIQLVLKVDQAVKFGDARFWTWNPAHELGPLGCATGGDPE